MPEDQCRLEQVHQLANVPGPVVCLEAAQRGARDDGGGDAELFAQLLDQRRDERPQVAVALAQRRYRDREYVEHAIYDETDVPDAHRADIERNVRFFLDRLTGRGR